MIIVWCLFFVLAGCSGDTNTKKQKHYNHAMELLAKNDEKAAMIELQNAIKIDPKYAEARYQLGLLYLKNNQPKQAFSQLVRVSSLDPDNTDARLKTAEFYFKWGDRKASKALVDAILTSHPDNVDALALQAAILITEKDPPNALKSIDKAISIRPDSDKLYTLRGQILAIQKNYDDAEKMFLKAIQVAPDKFRNYSHLLLFYKSFQKWDDAEKVAQGMVQRFPDQPKSFLMLITTYLQEGKIAEAQKAFKQATERFPDNINIWLNAAKFYQDRGEIDQAEAAYQSALQHAGDKKDQVLAEMANFYYNTRRYEKARKIMDEVLARDPKNSVAKLVKAKFLIKEKHIPDALNILTELVKKMPRRDEPYFVKAKAHMIAGEKEMALDSIREAIRRNPRNSLYHAVLAHLYLKSREIDGAKKEAKIAMQLNPKNFRATLIFINALLADKEYETVVNMLEKIRAKIPDNIEVLSNLGLAYLGLGKKDAALKTFEKILEIQPDNNPALIKIVQIMSLKNEKQIKKLEKQIEKLKNKGPKNEKQIRSLKKQIKDLREKNRKALISRVRKQLRKAPESASNLILLATLLMGDQQYDEALAILKKARQLSPMNPWTYSLSADILNRQQQTDKAIDEFLLLLKKRPNDPAVYMALGSLYQKKGDSKNAKKYYRQALHIKDDFAPAANNLAWLLAEENEPDLGEALRLAMIAKQQMPEEVHVADTLGWIHYKRKSYSLALHEFAYAVDKQPNNPIFRYHLALALYGEGRRDDAIRELKKTLADNRPFEARAEAEATLKTWLSKKG